MDLHALWRRDLSAVVRRGSTCERVAGRRLIGPGHDALDPVETLVLERSGRIDGWVTWQVGRLDLEDEVSHPIEGELPEFSASPDGETLLLNDLVICNEGDFVGARILFGALCPRLAIELGLSRAAAFVRLSDESRGLFSVSGFLMQKIWGPHVGAPDDAEDVFAPDDADEVGAPEDVFAPDCFDLLMEFQCLPRTFQRIEGGHNLVLAVWSNPVT